MNGYRDKQVDATQTALSAVLGIDENTKVVMVYDPGTKELADNFFLPALGKIGANLTKYFINQERPMASAPQDMLDAIPGNSVAINLFTNYSEEITVRKALIGSEVQQGLVVGHAPGITIDMFGTEENNFEQGAMLGNYQKMRDDAESLMQKLSGVHDINITSPSGTDITYTIKNADQKFETDTIVKPGHMGNLPCGEVWLAQTYADHSMGMLTGTGIVVANVCGGMKDGKINPEKPAIFVTENGILKKLETEDSELYQKIKTFLKIDDGLLESRENVDEITLRRPCELQELGIGLNDKARVTDNLLETEKVGGTAHSAWGLTGGLAIKDTDYYQDGLEKQVDAGSHGDFLYSEPTIVVRKVAEDIPVFEAKESDLGDWETVMEKGIFK